MNDKVKGFIAGAAVMSLFSGSVAFAATSTQIEVYFKNLKYMVDGIEKKPSEGQGFIYEGTTYVPLRFIGESLSKDVNWDGETETIWVGKRDGDFKYLTDVEYARVDGSAKENLYFNEWKYPVGLKFSVAGKKYNNGVGIILDYTIRSEDNKGSIDYNLNGEYTTLSGLIGIDDFTKNSDNMGTVIIKGAIPVMK
ncbi:stalk domain-containing protein [Paenibacillus sp. GYB004]|uniref:stalk domain-containing protein n=1 Tax=Paenibacillus sp. GYB004 TaxID=2994393 RepID=UPI002F96C0C5